MSCTIVNLLELPYPLAMCLSHNPPMETIDVLSKGTPAKSKNDCAPAYSVFGTGALFDDDYYDAKPPA